MKIDNIIIGNFKKINEVSIDLSSVNYLVGGNNAGKSSVLQAIHMAVSCAKLSVDRKEQVIPESELRYSPTSEFTLLGHHAPYENNRDGSRGKVEFSGTTNENADASYRIEIYKGRNYGNVGVDRSGVYQGFGQVIVDPKRLFSVYVPGISGIPHREEYKSYASVFQKVAGGDANLVFRNVVRLLKERDLLGRVSELMSDLVGPFSIRVDHNTEVHTYLNVEMSLNGGRYVPLDLVGSGVLQILQIIAYAALFQPVLLLVDEPDNHLHPSRQAQLARAFDKLSQMYGSTVIVSTHSRHLIASASPESKIIWMKNGEVETDDARDLTTILMELGALDQLDSTGAECIICTEDAKKTVLTTIVEELGVSEKVKVISYNGISNSGSAYAIQGMCELFPNKPKIIIHRDRDFMTDDELGKWGLEYTNRQMEILCPEWCDVEAYLATAAHCAAVYNISEQQASDIIDKLFSGAVEKLRKKFVEKRREVNLKYWRDGGGPATNDLWPPDEIPDPRFIYGKEMVALINDRMPKELGVAKRKLEEVVNSALKSIVRKKLVDAGIC